LPCLCHINRLTASVWSVVNETGLGGPWPTSFARVDEEVRREQLKKLWDRYGNYVVAAAVLLVAAGCGLARLHVVGGQEGCRGRRRLRGSRHARRGRQKRSEAEAAFAKVVAEGTPGYRHLARMREAAELAQSDTKAAIAAYDQIAADGAVGPRVAGPSPRCGRGRSSSTPAPCKRRSGGSSRLRRMTARSVTPRASFWCSLLGRAGDTAAAKRWFRHGHDRCADARRHPLPRRDADGIRRQREQELKSAA